MTYFPHIPDFVFTEKLGKGSYATVYKAYRKDAIREVVAVKCVQKSSLTKSAVENLLTEISILKKVKHKYIVELKDFQWDNTYIYLILEYCSGGDLSQFIRRRRRLPECIVQRFLQQLAKALQILQCHNIAHMDLKPQNILLSNSSKHPILKLGDFGFAQYLHPDSEGSSLRGSPLYMAPEILLNHHYDARVDLWSVGIILYECLFGQAPFSSSTFSELAEKIKSMKPIEIPYGAEISSDCRNLVLRLLQRDPDKRISFDEFFNHPFVDLEHLPSHESYAKGVNLVHAAVQEDGSGNPVAAIQHYCLGLEYLVPQLASEPDILRREVLRKKLIEYMDRAEELKNLLKANCELDPNASSSAASELEELIHDKTLQRSLHIAVKADSLVREEKYKEASNMYQEALELMVPIVSGEPPGRRKELLYIEVDRWMKKAEDLKSYLAVMKLYQQDLYDPVDKTQSFQNTVSDSQAGCIIQ